MVCVPWLRGQPLGFECRTDRLVLWSRRPSLASRWHSWTRTVPSGMSRWPGACGRSSSGPGPMRGFASFPGQSHFPLPSVSSSAGVHVGFESWLERDVVMWLDADPDVAAVASQPFWLSWPDGERLMRRAPDFFARRATGPAW